MDNKENEKITKKILIITVNSTSTKKIHINLGKNVQNYTNQLIVIIKDVGLYNYG